MTQYKLSLFSLIALSLFFFSNVYANNVSVQNVGIANQNSATEVKDIEFDISWDNSWRTSAAPNNWDACWIFAKYKKTSGTLWEHATLSSTDSDHNAPSGSSIDAVTDGKGVFMYRSEDGFGNVDWNNVGLRWTYGVDGVLDNDSVEICVFAIEMVYVPAGDFYLGDGNGSAKSYGSFCSATSINSSVQITNALSPKIRAIAGGDGQLSTTGVYLDGDGGIDLNGNGSFADAGDNPNYPVGYDAYYCMKYEISQGEYVEFVNKLNTLQGTAILTSSTGSRMNIFGTGNTRSTTTPNRPITLTGYQICAYLDWTALRPMTDTEFEKSCRGPLPSVYLEYAWGTTNVFSSIYALSFDGTGSEALNNPGINTGNCNYSSTNGSGVLNGPFRSGIFAASSPNHTREETGGSYYGIMELSGNLGEICTDLGDIQGRSFDGTNGDGEVHTTGFGNKSGWPNYNAGIGNNTQNDNGFAIKGGNWAYSKLYAQVSNRQHYNVSPVGISNSNYYGGRGVRNP